MNEICELAKILTNIESGDERSGRRRLIFSLAAAPPDAVFSDAAIAAVAAAGVATSAHVIISKAPSVHNGEPGGGGLNDIAFFTV